MAKTTIFTDIQKVKGQLLAKVARYEVVDSLPSTPQNKDTLYWLTTDETLYRYDAELDVYIDISNAGGASILNDLDDVEIASLNDGEVLVYELSSQKWKNAAQSGGVSSDLTPSGDHEANGFKITVTAGETLTQFDCVYIDSTDGKAYKANADSTEKHPTIAMATAAISADTSGEFLIYGVVRDDSWSWTPGAALYLSETDGLMTETAPSGVGDLIQSVACAISADVVIFNPSNDILEIT